ncbi:coiled-coil domain-containing protein 162-like [Apostichopus japonicus]|uniref:coiled-coil domain-containing protein 162-like n=1 Tax=Stichopus japonicus TaxID=307972 RepID=UPI003AB51425
MLNHFLNKKTTMGTILKNPEEAEKLKKSLIVEFCQRFHTRICQYSLRGQIIAYLNCFLVLLKDFPAVRKNHFVIGQPNEKKSKDDSPAGLTANPRELKKRPRRLLSQDGSTLLNLWFLPHHSEVLIMFKTLENEACMKALQCTLRIVSSLHDILQYLCAHSKLGSSPGRVHLQQKEYITADWGGTEGIIAELRETQKQINHLDNPTDPEQISYLLSLRRDVLFLEFDAAVRHSLRNTLLSTKNADGFKKVTNNMNAGLPALSNIQQPSIYGAYLRIPDPLQPRDFKAQEIFPWRAFLGRRGPYPIRFWQWTRIESYMQLCLCELKDVDRHAANGEILGVALLMEDVLQGGQQEIVMSPDEGKGEDQLIESERPGSAARPKSSASVRSKSSQQSHAEEDVEEEKKDVTVSLKNKALSRTTEPVKANILLKDFLLLWKRLEVFKEEWGQRKLGVQVIDSPFLYQKFCDTYKMDILYPVVKSIASKYGQGDLYEGMTLDSEPIVASKEASEMEMRAKQLVKLLDELEHHMIHEVQRKIAREHALVIAERAREEGNLPTDLWKRPAINERPVIPKPHIAEDFSRVLLGYCREDGDKMVIPKSDLNDALSSLTNVIMMREKNSYENYSMFYENLIRQHHQLLYQKEQEIKHLQRACAEASSVSLVDVQCQLADRSHELILEITALRSKIHEMREMTLTQQQEIREQVRDEYDQLVQNLFSSTFSLKNKFDQFGKGLYDECYGIVAEVREESAEAMSKYKSRSVGSGSDEVMDINMKRAQSLYQMRKENEEMGQVVLKMKALTNWKVTKIKETYNRKVSRLQNEIDKCRKDYLFIKMTAEEEVILLRQQVVALRGALSESERERESTSNLLEKEFRIKTDRKHREDQEAYNARQMELARADNLQKMLEDIDDKEVRIQIMSDDLQRTTHLHHTAQEKNRREFTHVKQRLHHERNLKLDAFQRVDELQTQVYDYEAAMSSLSRPFTSMSLFSSGKLPPMRSRASTSMDKSAKSRASTFRDTPSSTPWPPGTSFPPNYLQRSLTPDPRMVYQPGEDRSERMTLRPKTVGSRLRNKIAEQVLTNLEPDNHQMILQLQAMEQSNNKYK